MVGPQKGFNTPKEVPKSLEFITQRNLNSERTKKQEQFTYFVALIIMPEEHGFFGGMLRKMQTFAEKAKKEKYMEQIQRDIVLYKIRDCLYHFLFQKKSTL